MSKEPIEHDLFETRITLRLPAPLRDALARAAQASSRSMNGEIVFRLDEFDRLIEQLNEALKMLERREEALFTDRATLRKMTEEREQMLKALELAESVAQSFEHTTRDLQFTLRETQNEVVALKQEREALALQISNQGAETTAALEEIGKTTKASLAFMHGMEEMLLEVARGDDSRLRRVADALSARVKALSDEAEPKPKTKGS